MRDSAHAAHHLGCACFWRSGCSFYEAPAGSCPRFCLRPCESVAGSGGCAALWAAYPATATAQASSWSRLLCSLLFSWSANCHERHARRSEEHTSELQSLMRISYAVFCLKKKTKILLISFSIVRYFS